MPLVIRRAIHQKIVKMPEMRQFIEDFRAVSGIRLAFVDELGQGDEMDHPSNSICSRLQAGAQGAALCSRTRHNLLDRATGGTAFAFCDAGLCEAAVPLHIGGVVAGYFLIGGTLPRQPSSSDIQKARHLLQKAGMSLDHSSLDDLLSKSKVVAEDLMRAYLRIIGHFSAQISFMLTDQMLKPEAALPAPVEKAITLIRQKALSEKLELPALAKACGVSTGHLSRLFHGSTGLTYKEYIALVRAENAKTLLTTTSKNVTEIAFDSGFQSISQFHRVFRKIHGVSPLEFRKQAVRQRNSINPMSTGCLSTF
ncbi:helix-turn-helix domain-containing protein [Oscillatoria laete-virens NRMC-F 0139]|nr:helix-turn-helix domain-containing protein [Oscillatoria laete-virens]MDL5055358.1 helix-turn-helix domain-containing protein [Oscillatoria laete-virens NRMC-F 0139]